MRDPNLHAAFLETVKHYNKQYNIYFGTEHSVLNNKPPSTSMTEVAAVLRGTQTPSLCPACRRPVNHRPQLPDPAAWRWSLTAKGNVNSELKRVLLALKGGKKYKTKPTKTIILTQNILASHVTSSVPKAYYCMCAVPTFRTIKLQTLSTKPAGNFSITEKEHKRAFSINRQNLNCFLLESRLRKLEYLQLLLFW